MEKSLMNKLDSETTNWGMAAHLLGLSGLVVPFGNLAGPLIVLAAKGKQHPFIEQHAKEASNFQITCFIYTVISAVLILVAVGIILLPVVLIFQLVLAIIAGIKAGNGEDFRYPLTIRFIR